METAAVGNCRSSIPTCGKSPVTKGQSKKFDTLLSHSLEKVQGSKEAEAGKDVQKNRLPKELSTLLSKFEKWATAETAPGESRFFKMKVNFSEKVTADAGAQVYEPIRLRGHFTMPGVSCRPQSFDALIQGETFRPAYSVEIETGTNRFTPGRSDLEISSLKEVKSFMASFLDYMLQKNEEEENDPIKELMNLGVEKSKSNYGFSAKNMGKEMKDFFDIYCESKVKT
jgi:hypothetical protein